MQFEPLRKLQILLGLLHRFRRKCNHDRNQKRQNCGGGRSRSRLQCSVGTRLALSLLHERSRKRTFFTALPGDLVHILRSGSAVSRREVPGATAGGGARIGSIQDELGTARSTEARVGADREGDGDCGRSSRFEGGEGGI